MSKDILISILNDLLSEKVKGLESRTTAEIQTITKLKTDTETIKSKKYKYHYQYRIL